MRGFGKQHDFDVITRVVRPTMASTFQVKVLSGRALPSFSGTHADCSTDLKISPQRTFRRQLVRSLAGQGHSEPVTLLGTRFGESTRRSISMREGGESATLPARNQDGDLVLSPVCHWQDDDIWEGIALYGSGARPGYSDFEDMRRIYAHAVGTSCAVVADAILEGTGLRRQGKCGARLGCHVCQMAEDKCLANMVEYDGRYAYAAGLQRLNRFIRNTRFDWSRRHWVGRTIRGGCIKVQPDTYHPTMVRELTRYMLQLDYDEQCRAERTGARPKFELLPLDLLTADAACGPALQVTAGREVWALPTAQQFSVDAEAAFLISEFEVDRLLEIHDVGVGSGQVTAGYRWYAQYGCLTLSHSQRVEHDEIACRTAYKDRLGLTLDYDVGALRSRAASFEDLPASSQLAWRQAATPQQSLF